MKITKIQDPNGADLPTIKEINGNQNPNNDPQRKGQSEGNFYPELNSKIGPGMNPRIQRLRKLSFEATPSIAIERALHQTTFYQENYGKYSIPVLRALTFLDHCKRKTLYLGADELIVGERGPKPKAVPTFPELTCHSVEDLHVLNNRDQQRYTISQTDIDIYEQEVIPYWKDRTQRERIFKHVPAEWKRAYEAGLFTEFMEQRAPGHTALDGKIYRKGMLDFKKEIQIHLDSLDYTNDPEANDKAEELTAMKISCDAVIIFANRHAELAEEKAKTEKSEERKQELQKLQRFVVGYRQMHLEIFTKLYKCIGLYILEPLLN